MRHLALASAVVALLAVAGREEEEEDDERCYWSSSTRYCLPSILGVGTVNSGTTSLAHYLNAHPLLTYGTKKEHHFFRFRPAAGSGVTLSTGRQVDVNLTHSTTTTAAPTAGLAQVGRGSRRDYALEFPMPPGATKAFDFDPCYLGHGAYSRASMLAIGDFFLQGDRMLLPKIVAVLRNPATQSCRRQRKVPCAAALAASNWTGARDVCAPPVVDNFHNYCYSEHVEEWHRHLGGQDNVYLVKSEELRNGDTRRTVVTDLVRFLLGDDGSVLGRRSDGRGPPPWPGDALLSEMLNVHATKSSQTQTDDFQRCVDLQTRPDSFLSKCNERLVALRGGDPRWFWWSASSSTSCARDDVDTS